MSNCWKCGKELPEPQVECEDGCPLSPEELERTTQKIFSALTGRLQLYKLDWSKLTTLEDYRLVCECLLHRHIAIHADHPFFEQLKKFMRPL